MAWKDSQKKNKKNSGGYCVFWFVYVGKGNRVGYFTGVVVYRINYVVSYDGQLYHNKG